MTGSDTTAASRVVTTALLAAALLGVASCTSGPSEPPTPPVTSLPSAAAPLPTVAAEEAEAEAKVRAAYNGYVEAYIAAAAIPDTSGGKIRDFTADPLLSLLKEDLQFKAEQGHVLKGRPTWTVKVVKVNVKQRPFTAEIEECFDGTNWKLVKRSTGKPAAVPDQNRKYLVTSEAAQFDDGRWLIRRSETHRDRPC